MQLHRPQSLERFRAKGARLLVVTFAPLEELKEWVPYFRRTFLEHDQNGTGVTGEIFSHTKFLADPELSAYHAYGLGRHSVFEAYGPRIVRQYLRWIIEGRPLRMTRQDTLQRGGDFVVGRDGRLTLSHVGRDQAERPRISKILDALV
ncbi:MAG TPA: AhpC/TSA family protein [Blastocatellia bacterium]|nr:AhpC/TSA family protein [Blastocatellia bacterium]